MTFSSAQFRFRLSMAMSNRPARDLFDHRDTTAGLMRIGGQAAQFYVTAELISKTADQIV